MRALTLTILPVNVILFMRLSGGSVLVWYLGKWGSVMGYDACTVVSSVDLGSMADAS